MQKSQNKITEGSILKSILVLALPIVFANLFQTAYQLVDTFWVGRLGGEAIAAVSLSFPIIFLIISLGMGVTIAGSILVAQYKGKKQYKNVDYVAAQTFLMVFFVSIFLTIVGYFISGPLVRMMGVEPAVFSDAVSYMKISFLGLIFLFLFFSFQSLMRGVGDVKMPLYIVAGTVLLNLFLDPLFIFGYGPIPALGVSGAAMATVFTEGLAALAGLLILFSGKYDVRLKKKYLSIDFVLIKRLFKLGLPVMVEQSTRALGMLVMSFLVASFGTVVIASYGIGSRILGFAIIPALGLAMANSALVGQNMGAGKIERAEKASKISALMGFGALTAFGLVVFVLAEQIAGFFVPNDPVIIQTSASFLRIMSLFFGFISVQQILSGTFRAAGDTLISMVLVVVSFWILRFPLAYLLSHNTSLSYSGLWWSFPISDIIASAAVILLFVKGSWKKKKITKEFKLVEETTEETLVGGGLD